MGTTTTGWNYFNVTFQSAFISTPAILLTFWEGIGINNSGSNSVTHFKVANASTTGFTIAVYETSATGDVFFLLDCNSKNSVILNISKLL